MGGRSFSRHVLEPGRAEHGELGDLEGTVQLVLDNANRFVPFTGDRAHSRQGRRLSRRGLLRGSARAAGGPGSGISRRPKRDRSSGGRSVGRNGFV